MVRFNALSTLTLVAFALAFLAVWSLAGSSSVAAYAPPYYYQTGDYWSYLNAFFFSVVFSLLFFGAGAPLAMGMEGAKYASLFYTGAMPAFDLLFLIPSLFGSVGAVTLSQGILADFRNQGSVFAYWPRALRYFDSALILLFILLAVRATAVALRLT